MGIINSDDHYIYEYGQKSLRRTRVALLVNRRVWSAAVLAWFQNWLISVCVQEKPFNITVIQVYVPTTYAEETKVDQVYADLQQLPELTPKETCIFIIVYWNAEVGSQEIPGVTGSLALEYKMKQGN